MRRQFRHQRGAGDVLPQPVGDVGILLVAFDERSSLGLVRLRVRQITPEMESVFNDMLTRSRNPRGGSDGPGGLSEITDEDIDSLFN